VGGFVSIPEYAGTDPLYPPGSVTIEKLPNDTLLEIFSFYVEEAYESCEDHEFERIDAWITLVHVCQKWRDLAFASSHRLNLRILCTNRRPAREMLDIWPTLPIVIWYQGIDDEPSLPRMEAQDADNIIYLLGHRDRVSQISLMDPPPSLLDRLAATMQESFPALTYLELEPTDDESTVVLQDSFLGGSAPCLRSLRLHSTQFPTGTLQKLLLSANDLVDLHLLMIPVSQYIPPQEMVLCLSSLTRLEDLRLGLQYPVFCLRPPIGHPPPTRVHLPSLTNLWFSGDSDYLNQLVASINAPLLYVFEMVFLNQSNFRILQLTEFIGRIEKFKVLDRAKAHFYDEVVNVTLSSQKETVDRPILAVHNRCGPESWQLVALAQVHSSFLSLLSSLERLDITEDPDLPPLLQDDVLGVYWLQLLDPFPGVKDLYLSGVPGLHVARGLQGLNEDRVTEKLPALQRIFLGGETSEAMMEAIGPFIAALQLSGHPVTVDCWEDEEAED